VKETCPEEGKVCWKEKEKVRRGGGRGQVVWGKGENTDVSGEGSGGNEGGGEGREAE